MDYYKQVRKLILSSVILAGLIPLLLLTGMLLFQFHKSYETKTWSQLEILTKMHAEHIDTFLNKRVADLKMLSKWFTYGELSHRAFLEDKLALLQSSYGTYFVDLGVIDERGTQISYAGPFRLNEVNYSDSEWFKKAIERETYVSDVFLGLRNYPHFIVTIRDDWYGRKWLLRATIDFMAFTTVVENIRVGSSGSAFILNKRGEFQTAVKEETQQDSNRIVEKLSKYDCINGVCVKTTYEGSAGKKKLMVAYPLKNGEWMLIFTQDFSDAFSDFNTAINFAIAILLVSMVAIISIAFVLSRTIIKKLIQLDKEKEMLSQQIIETGKLASIGELAAGIAHEINNPVAIMVEEAGWIEDLLEEEDLSSSKNIDELRKSLKQIRTQGKRCKDITHKLLSFARKTDPVVKELNVNNLLKELVAISTQRAKYSNVEITEHYDEGLPAILGAESELQQVFLNIINNALDAMEKKGGKLNISTEKYDRVVLIKFQDTGHGIPKANLPRIFDPFFTTKPVGRGTGLGLSICYGIIKKLGGEIEVQSAVDVGTTFTIALPIPNSVSKSEA